jgi:hypothetical protein
VLLRHHEAAGDVMSPRAVAWSIDHEWKPEAETLEAFVRRRFPALSRDALAAALELIAEPLVEGMVA